MTDEQVRELLDRDAGLAPGIRGDYSTWECKLFRRGYAAGMREAARIAQEQGDACQRDRYAHHAEGCDLVRDAIRAAAGEES